MALNYDKVTGWVSSDGDPRWRATKAAVDRVCDQQIIWLKDDKRGGRRVHVGHLQDGTPVAVLRFYPAGKMWSAKIEGFEAWRLNRVLQHEGFWDVAGFDQLPDARKFVETVLGQAGAHFTPTAMPPNEKVSASEARRRQRGEKKYTVWIPDTDAARSRVKALAEELCSDARSPVDGDKSVG